MSNDDAVFNNDHTVTMSRQKYREFLNFQRKAEGLYDWEQEKCAFETLTLKGIIADIDGHLRYEDSITIRNLLRELEKNKDKIPLDANLINRSMEAWNDLSFRMISLDKLTDKSSRLKLRDFKKYLLDIFKGYRNFLPPNTDVSKILEFCENFDSDISFYEDGYILKVIVVEIIKNICRYSLYKFDGELKIRISLTDNKLIISSTGFPVKDDEIPNLFILRKDPQRLLSRGKQSLFLCKHYVDKSYYLEDIYYATDKSEQILDGVNFVIKMKPSNIVNNI